MVDWMKRARHSRGHCSDPRPGVGHGAGGARVHGGIHGDGCLATRIRIRELSGANMPSTLLLCRWPCIICGKGGLRHPPFFFFFEADKQ
jgi:hypothetical protein